MSKNDGGQAFPMKQPLMSDEWGMSLRDYFAARAMQVVFDQCNEFPDENWRYGVAVDAYKIADAMLEAREEGK